MMTIAGGCLCGAVRYEAKGPPMFAGYCCCDDYQKSSGSGFIPFIGFAAPDIAITGEVITYKHALADGRTATRNFCTRCGSLVFGAERGIDAMHTIYAGTLDDPAQFRPQMAINVRFKPDWVVLPEGLPTFPGMPPR